MLGNTSIIFSSNANIRSILNEERKRMTNHTSKDQSLGKRH